jgi:hypothetical protein
MMVPVIALLLLFAAPANEGWWTPSIGDTWQIQFAASDVDPALAVDVIDLDAFETDAETVSGLQDRGMRVLCYVNAGAWEDWRPDAGSFPDEIIGLAWPEWEGERYLDIRRLDLLGPIIEARLDMCAKKGFDGIEPDNIDTYQTGEEATGFAITEADQVAFNLWLAEEAHARDLAIGQKNIGDLTPDLVERFDFAVTEDCFVDGWCERMSPYIAAGKPVFAIEYTDTGADLDIICPQAAALGFSVVLKHRDLDAWAERCA